MWQIRESQPHYGIQPQRYIYIGKHRHQLPDFMPGRVGDQVTVLEMSAQPQLHEQLHDAIDLLQEHGILSQQQADAAGVIIEMKGTI